jgi:hypothetical protein
MFKDKSFLAHAALLPLFYQLKHSGTFVLIVHILFPTKLVHQGWPRKMGWSDGYATMLEFTTEPAIIFIC